MQARNSSRPLLYFFLTLPYGISSGFISITLPFLITRAGLSVAYAGSIVAIGMSSNVWRFLWGPLADLTLTLRRWYALGLGFSAVGLLVVSCIPLRREESGLLALVVFLSQVAATFIVLPIGGMVAHTVAEEEKGRASGWYQAGNVGGAGLGGGAGVWLASHFSAATAGMALCTVMIACAFALIFVPDVRASTESIGHRLRAMGRDFRGLLTSRIAILTALICASPIGVGAASNLWSAIAPGWRATADTVALVSGILSGLVSAIGSISGGWIADRLGGWWAFFGSGMLTAVVAAAMAAAPRTSEAFAIGVLFYAFSYGVANAAFSAVLFFVIGRGAASTKYSTIASLGNVPVVYMTAFDGWLHDRFGAGSMLLAEAGLGASCVLLGLCLLGCIRRRE